MVDCAGLEQFDLLGDQPGRGGGDRLCGAPPGAGAAAGASAAAMRPGWAVRAGPGGGRPARGDDDADARSAGAPTIPAYRQLFTSLYIPGASPEQMRLVQRDAARQRVAGECGEAAACAVARSTSASCCRKVTTPTLVFHATRRPGGAFRAGEELAAKIPGAAFVPLESKNHILLEKEPAWREFVRDHARVPRATGPPTRFPGHRPAKAGPRTTMRTCTAQGRGADRLCRQRRRLPAGQGAQLDDPSRDTTGRARSYGTGSRNARGPTGFVRSDMRGFGTVGARDPPSFTFEAMVEDIGCGRRRRRASSSATCSASRTARRSRWPMRRAIRSGSASWCWSMASRPGWRVRADPEELAWREVAAGDEPARSRASAGACSARCSSRSISRRRARS